MKVSEAEKLATDMIALYERKRREQGYQLVPPSSIVLDEVEVHALPWDGPVQIQVWRRDANRLGGLVPELIYHDDSDLTDSNDNRVDPHEKVYILREAKA